MGGSKGGRVLTVKQGKDLLYFLILSADFFVEPVDVRVRLGEELLEVGGAQVGYGGCFRFSFVAHLDFGCLSHYSPMV